MGGSIPVLDVTALSANDAKGRHGLLRAFADAYRTVGFSYVVNHGIDPSLTAELFAASRRFHALPLAEKLAIELDANHRGFIPINTSTDTATRLAEVTAPNQSESFLALCEHDANSPEVRAGDYLAGSNQWPRLDGFEEAVMAYHAALCQLGQQLMGVAIEALGSDPAPILAHFESPTAFLRLLHYPPQRNDSDAGVFGSAPHVDYGCLTLLAQDDIGGLEVGTASGEWITVPPRDNAFVLNVGEMLHRWSNGIYRATPHRVLNRSTVPRYSCPFFFDPHPSALVRPLASCVTSQRSELFEPVRFGDALRNELEAGFDHHARQSPGKRPGLVCD